MSNVYISRPKFLYEIKDVMKTYTITLEQAMALYFLVYGIEWKLGAADLIVLFQKGLIKPGNKVVIKKLFAHLQGEQTELVFNFSTSPKGTVETLKLAKNLEEKFVPKDEQTEKYIKATADTYFKGDIGIAKYFLIFKAMFPKANKVGDNSKWNIHFGFNYEEDSRWSDSMVVVKKFKDIYLKKDIGYFLTGLYYYIKDSINFDLGTSYATKPNKFLLSYKSWYELAETRFKSQKEEIKTSEKSL